MTDSCFGELMLNASPASSKIFALRDASSASMRVDWLASAGRSIRTPCRSISASTGTSGSSRSRNSGSRPSSRRRGAQLLGELPRQIRALAGEAQQRRGRQVRQRDGFLARAADVFLRERLVAQMLERDFLDGVARPGRVEHVAGEHRVELEPCERDALVREHHQIELQIVADLRDRRIFEDALRAPPAPLSD